MNQMLVVRFVDFGGVGVGQRQHGLHAGIQSGKDFAPLGPVALFELDADRRLQLGLPVGLRVLTYGPGRMSVAGVGGLWALLAAWPRR